MWVFWEVKIIDVKKIQPYICVTILGFCKMHSISSLDHEDSELFLMQELSCFCPTCVDGSEKEDCNNIKHALPWKTIKLEPIERTSIREIMDDDDTSGLYVFSPFLLTLIKTLKFKLTFRFDFHGYCRCSIQVLQIPNCANSLPIFYSFHYVLIDKIISGG
jgi:hypothetical protein